MAKPEWGTKHQCPKCGERFYDLKKAFPLTCVACGHAFEPETLLKSKAPLPDESAKVRKAPVPVEEGLEIEAEEFEEEFEDETDDDAILEDELVDEEDVSDVLDKRAGEDDI